MNTILLQSSLSSVIECAAGSRYVFSFPSEEAEISRSGDDLLLSFENGNTITLAGFYTTYTLQDMPLFEVEGVEIAGADFMAALDNPDLMPAAGPEPANDSHYQEWGVSDLLGGLDRLGGVDVQWQDSAEKTDTPPGPRTRGSRGFLYVINRFQVKKTRRTGIV